MKNNLKKNLPRTIRELETFARKKSSKGAFNWLNAAAESGITKKINQDAFKKVEIIPNFFHDTSNLDTSTSFFGHKISMPIIISPMGHQTQFHKNGEAELAAGTKFENILLCFSTQGRMSLKQIKRKCPRGKFIWDFFPFGPRKWIKEQIMDAKNAGAIGCALTVDAPIRSVRYLDRETKYDARKHGKFYKPMPPDISYARKLKSEDLKWMKEYCDKTPFIVKGILSSHDANLAIKNGVDVIWVSNHGGRMLESGYSSLKALIEIKKNVKKKIPIFFDSGVRSGSDILKAIGLGADIVGLGRPVIYGLIWAGKKGVNHMLTLLREEFETAMINSSISKISDITARNIMKSNLK